VQLLFQRGYGGGVLRALNDYIAKEWLDRDPRMRASIVIPMQNANTGDEIERCAKDKPRAECWCWRCRRALGRRHFWPI